MWRRAPVCRPVREAEARRSAAAVRPAGNPGCRRGDSEYRPRRAAAPVDRADQFDVTGQHATPALYVIEDIHWIDGVSESMFVDLMSVIPQTHSVVLLTYRPEYRGPLSHLAGAQTVSLVPLSDSETGVLLDELLGNDPSTVAISDLIAGHAAGNPFFAQEMVHELAERGVLEGERGQYICATDVSEISVPATLQATIAARIDRLDPRSEADYQRRGGYRIAVYRRLARRARR